jgi:hypothetical protein
MSNRSARLALVGFGAATVCGFLGGVPAHAAPYTEDPSIAVSTPNPAVGGTLTGTLTDFTPHELVDVRLHSKVVDLATVAVDEHGDGTFAVTLPPGFTCSHHITGTGETSGATAGTNVVIGPIEDCTGDSDSGDGDSGDGDSGDGDGDGNHSGGNNGGGAGNHGNGNTGYGNHGDHNSGFGNHGNGNTGSGNHGDHNSGYGNHDNGGGPAGSAAANWGNAAYAEPQDPSRGGLELAGAGAGLALLAIVGGGVVTTRRRRT